MRRGAAELLEGHFLAGDRLHHVGAGDEHVRAAFDHQHEVGHRGRVDGPTGARPHDQAELRDHARRLDIPPEDLRVAGEGDDALLDPRPAGVVDPDHRAAELRRQVHHLADLLREDLRETAAEDREVLREDEYTPAEDRPVAGDDRIAVGPPLPHPELGLAVTHVAVELDERAGIEELFRALTREELALVSLTLDRALAAGVTGFVAQLLQALELGRRRLDLARHGASVTRPSLVRGTRTCFDRPIMSKPGPAALRTEAD